MKHYGDRLHRLVISPITPAHEIFHTAGLPDLTCGGDERAGLCTQPPSFQVRFSLAFQGDTDSLAARFELAEKGRVPHSAAARHRRAYPDDRAPELRRGDQHAAPDFSR